MNCLYRSRALATFRRPLIPAKALVSQLLTCIAKGQAKANQQRNATLVDFTSSGLRRRTFRNTVALRNQKFRSHVKAKVPGQKAPLPPLYPKEDIAAGVTFASCALNSACFVYMVGEVEATNSRKAVKRLQSFLKHWTFSVHNLEGGLWHTLLTSSCTHLSQQILLVNTLGVWCLG